MLGHAVLESARDQEHRAVLPPTQAAMRPDEPLERRDVERDRIHGAVDVEVWRLRHLQGASQDACRMLAEGDQRIGPLDVTGGQVPPSGLTDRPRQALGVQTRDESDSWV